MIESRWDVPDRTMTAKIRRLTTALLRNEIQRRGCLLSLHLFWDRAYAGESRRLLRSRRFDDRRVYNQIATRNGMTLMIVTRQSYVWSAFSPEMRGLP